MSVKYGEKMNKKEVIEIVAGAVEQTEASSPELLTLKRVQMSQWLYKRFNIAIKEMVVSIKDGMPYLRVEYLNNKGKVSEVKISMAKYQERLTKELEKMNEGSLNDGE